jgi:hypothetical protein
MFAITDNFQDVIQHPALMPAHSSLHILGQEIPLCLLWPVTSMRRTSVAQHCGCGMATQSLSNHVKNRPNT